VKIVRLDCRRNSAEVECSVRFELDRLGLNTAEYRRTAAFVFVGMRLLADDILIAALAMGQQRHQIALGSGGQEQTGLVAGNVGSFLLQVIDGGVVTKYIVAYFGLCHGLSHPGTGPGYCIAA